jgi:hypothetical protein
MSIKSYYALAFSFLATFSYANELAPNQPPARLPSDLFLSTPNYTFDTYFNALFMQPSSSNLQYAAENYSNTTYTPKWKVYEVDTNYQFGFDVGLSGYFHDANSSIRINWEHFHSSNSNSESADYSLNSINPLFNANDTYLPYQETFGRNKFYLDEINLQYGTQVNVGNLIKLQLFSGVGFGRLKQNLVSRFYNPGHTETLKSHTSSTFNGAGPEAGFDFNQKIVAGLSFVGKAKASLLAGSQKNKTTYYTTSPEYSAEGIPNPLKQSLKPESKSHLISELDGCLGLSYIVSFCKHYMIDIEAGYRAQIYIDAIETTNINTVYQPTVVAIGFPGISPTSFAESLSNFTIAGPYVMLKIGF